MTNNVAAFNQIKYTKLVQALLQEKLIAMDIANTTLLAQMPNGNTITFPRPTYSSASTYVKYTDATISSVESTSETLVINETPMIVFEYDEIDNEDNAWDVVAVESKNNAFRIQRYIEWKFHNQYQYFNNTYNGWVATALSNTNSVDTFLLAYAQLVNQWVDDSNICLVVDPFDVSKIATQAVSSRFTLWDDAFKRGYKGTVANMDMYSTNNLTCVGTIALATQPADWDTITYGWVVFTFKTTLWTTAGNVLRWADAAASIANFVAAFNGAAGAGTTYVEFTKSDRAKLEWTTASVNSTTVTFTSLRWYRWVARSMTTATNKFGQFVSYAYAMERGSIHMVLRDNVRVKVEEIQKQIGKRYFTWSRFGLKTFAQWAERGIIIPIEKKAAE